jgi:mannosidase alpha-like ER degradation enhancer 2
MSLRLAALLVILVGACGSRAPTPSPTPPAPASARSDDTAALAARVKAELRHAWISYETHASGHDELKPVSKTGHDWYAATLLITPVDSLDTLILAGLTDEAARAQALIVDKLSFDHDISVKNFEITIRVLGGLLSGYQLTGDKRLLALADDLGRRLLPAFGSKTGMPYRFVNLRTGAVDGVVSNPAEIGTLILEFGLLAKLTGKPVYYDKAKQALVALFERRSKLGLVGSTIDVETGAWVDKASHVGGGIDSYYEYLLKGWLLFGDEDLGRMWKDSVTALNQHVADEAPSGLWYGPVDMDTGARKGSDWGALEAFLPAVFVLGDDVERARRLQASSYLMWTTAGIEPDGFDYRAMKVTHPSYPLRPEIIESAYFLHRATGDRAYLDMGVRFLDDLVAHCRTDDGYVGLKNVATREKADLMHSFFLAETLKYLYLLFAPDDVLDSTAVIFNTEAHPLRRTW